MGHLDDGQVVDALDPGAARDHAGTCTPCGLRVQALRDALGAAQAAEVPEPPAFYWASFRRQVGGRIEAEGRPARGRVGVTLAALASAAAVAVVLLRAPAPAAAPERPVALPSWSALPEDDPAEDVLVALPGDAELLSEAGCGEVATCVAGLTDHESSEVVALLRDELAPGGKL